MSCFLSFSTIVISPQLIIAIIKLLGGSSSVVGLYTSIQGVSGQLALFAAPVCLYFFNNEKKMIMFFSGLSLAGFFLVPVSIQYFVPGIAIILLITALSIHSFGTQNVAFPLNNIIRKSFNPQNRARLIGTASAISCLALGTAGLFIKKILEKDLSFPKDYSVIIFTGALIYMLYMLNFLFIKNDKNQMPSVKKDTEEKTLLKTFSSIASAAKNRNILFLFIGIVFLSLSTSSMQLLLSVGFDLDHEVMTDNISLGIPLSMFIKFIFYYIFGRIASRKGNKFVILIIGSLGLFAPLTALVLPVKYYLAVIISHNLLMMWYPFSLNEMFDHCSNENYSGYFVLFSLLSLPGSLATPLLGLLADNSLPVFSITLIFFILIGLLFISFRYKSYDASVLI
jgi:hypothetical protein